MEGGAGAHNVPHVSAALAEWVLATRTCLLSIIFQVYIYIYILT